MRSGNGFLGGWTGLTETLGFIGTGRVGLSPVIALSPQPGTPFLTV